MKKLIASRGYTVECVSWENDGDNYQTNTKTFQSPADAIALRNLCLMSSAKDIGNKADIEALSPEIIDRIKIFMVENPALMIDGGCPVDTWRDLTTEMTDYPEYEIARVVESAVVYFSPEDIYLEIVND